MSVSACVSECAHMCVSPCAHDTIPVWQSEDHLEAQFSPFTFLEVEIELIFPARLDGKHLFWPTTSKGLVCEISTKVSDMGH